MPTQPVVAVVNTNPDLLELLKVHIEKAGFVVLVIHIHDIRQGLDIGAVLAQHDPQVIVYDVVFPYESNWHFLQHLRETTFKGRQFVLTTPNEAGIRQLVGKDERVYEVLDARVDTDTIVQAVREAARARPTT